MFILFFRWHSNCTWIRSICQRPRLQRSCWETVLFLWLWANMHLLWRLSPRCQWKSWHLSSVCRLWLSRITKTRSNVLKSWLMTDILVLFDICSAWLQNVDTHYITWFKVVTFCSPNIFLKLLPFVHNVLLKQSCSQFPHKYATKKWSLKNDVLYDMKLLQTLVKSS